MFVKSVFIKLQVGLYHPLADTHSVMKLKTNVIKIIIMFNNKCCCSMFFHCFLSKYKGEFDETWQVAS